MEKKLPNTMVQIARMTKQGREVKVIPRSSWEIMFDKQGWELIEDLPIQKAQIPAEVVEFINKGKGADVVKNDDGIVEVETDLKDESIIINELEKGSIPEFPELLELSVNKIKLLDLTPEQVAFLKVKDERKSLKTYLETL